jgi:hypothetical protein
LTPNSRSGSAEIDNDPKSGEPQSTADALVSFRGHSHGLVEMLALIRMTFLNTSGSSLESLFTSNSRSGKAKFDLSPPVRAAAA